MTQLAPSSKKQAWYLQSETGINGDEGASITVFGGAASSGKSYMSLMDMVKHVHNPDYRGVVVRRTSSRLKGEGGLWDESYDMYNSIPQLKDKIRFQSQTMRIQFPSRAAIKMESCEHDKDRMKFRGWQAASILVDEAQEFSEVVVMELYSRLRSKSNIKPYMKMTCNPEFNCFLREWLQEAGYLDEANFGIPKPEMDGKLMYFTRQGNKMIWHESKEHLIKTYGEESAPISFRFISATIYDNPIAMKRDPTYVSKLKAKPRVERMRLLEGAWLVTEEGAGYFKKDWVTQLLPFDLPDMVRYVRAYDIAATVPSEAYPNPDWTVGVLASKDRDGNVYILDVYRDRQRTAKVMDDMLSIAIQDQKDYGDVTVVIPRDVGAAGQRSADDMASKLQAEDITVKIKKVGNQKNRKIKMFERVSVMSENGQVYVLNDGSDWREDFFDELEKFDGSKKNKDDQVDATSDAVDELISGKVFAVIPIPDVSAPTLLGR